MIGICFDKYNGVSQHETPFINRDMTTETRLERCHIDQFFFVAPAPQILQKQSPNGIEMSRLAGNLYGALKEIPLKEATMSRRVTAAWRRDAYVSKAAERMIELLKTAIDHEEKLA